MTGGTRANTIFRTAIDKDAAPYLRGGIQSRPHFPLIDLVEESFLVEVATPALNSEFHEPVSL